MWADYPVGGCYDFVCACDVLLGWVQIFLVTFTPQVQELCARQITVNKDFDVFAYSNCVRT